MPYRCIVPPCKENDKNEPNVPKDKTLSDIWTCAIKRKDFTLDKFHVFAIHKVTIRTNWWQINIVKVLKAENPPFFFKFIYFKIKFFI